MVYVDRRLLGVERWCLGEPKDARMRLGEQILRSVAFIGAGTASGDFHIGGTAFIVGVPFANDETRGHHYLVTAKHNIAGARKYGTVGVRVNLLGGGTRLYETHDKWAYSDNEASDVAVMFAAFPQDVDLATIRYSSLVTDRVIAEWGIGVGDDLAIVGLFRKREGERRNLPIVRMGSIAATPDEPLIDPKTGWEYEAYLAETRSIGGLSGSPVFVVLKGGDAFPSGETLPLGKIRLCLLGLIRGHWDKAAYEMGDFASTENEIFNTGIAIVSPISDVIKILESEAFVEARKKREKEARQENEPVEDFGGSKSEFERFEDMTRTLANTPKPENEQRKDES